MKLTSAFLISAAVLAVLFFIKPADSCTGSQVVKKVVRTKHEKGRIDGYEDKTWKMRKTDVDKNQRYYEVSGQNELTIDHKEHFVDDYRINKPGRQSHRWIDHTESTVTNRSKSTWVPA